MVITADDADFWRVAFGAQVTIGEREWLRTVAATLESKFGKQMVMVNIGVLAGCTMHCMRAGAQNAALYGVDNDYSSHKIQKRHLLDATFLTADSRTAEFDNPIHLLFIDGDHHYDVVKADIANWMPRVVVGGVIAFHDYAPTGGNLEMFPHLEGVKRAVDEFANIKPRCWKKCVTVDSIIAFQLVASIGV